MENDNEQVGIINEDNTNLKDLLRMENRNPRSSFSSSMDSSCVTDLSDGGSDGEEAISARA